MHHERKWMRIRREIEEIYCECYFENMSSKHIKIISHVFCTSASGEVWIYFRFRSRNQSKCEQSKRIQKQQGYYCGGTRFGSVVVTQEKVTVWRLWGLVVLAYRLELNTACYKAHVDCHQESEVLHSYSRQSRPSSGQHMRSGDMRDCVYLSVVDVKSV